MLKPLEFDTSHCLRPVFTTSVIQKLDRREFLNLVGTDGQGAGRLLEDVEKCLWKVKEVEVIVIDMKRYVNSYAEFEKALFWSMAIAEGITTFGDLIRALQFDMGDIPIFLLLNHFDVLFDNIGIAEAGYTTQFFHNLNALGKTKVSLLCVTKKPHRASMIYQTKKVGKTSWLDLKPLELPSLKEDRLRVDLGRQCEINNCKEDEYKPFVKGMMSYEDVYVFMKYLVEHLHHDSDFYSCVPRKLLKKYRKKFVYLYYSGTWLQSLRELRGGWNRMKFVLGIGQELSVWGLGVSWIKKKVGG